MTFSIKSINRSEFSLVILSTNYVQVVVHNLLINAKFGCFFLSSNTIMSSS